MVQVHCSRRRLLRRGLEFHVCTINESAHTKKVWKPIEGTSYESFYSLLISVFSLCLNFLATKIPFTWFHAPTSASSHTDTHTNTWQLTRLGFYSFPLLIALCGYLDLFFFLFPSLTADFLFCFVGMNTTENSLAVHITLLPFQIYFWFRAIDLLCRVFVNGPGSQGSIPGRVIPKTQKMVLDAGLLNTQHYMVRIKGKVEQSRERSSTLT